MSLANELSEAGHPPDDLRTTAEVRLEQLESGFSITSIRLNTVGVVPGIDAATFAAHRRRGGGELPGVAGARRDRDHRGGKA